MGVDIEVSGGLACRDCGARCDTPLWALTDDGERDTEDGVEVYALSPRKCSACGSRRVKLAIRVA